MLLLLEKYVLTQYDLQVFGNPDTDVTSLAKLFQEKRHLRSIWFKKGIVMSVLACLQDNLSVNQFLMSG